jgi:TatD DNase family protein
MWIDTHCHLDAPEFDADRDAVVAAARAAGVRQMVLPAVEVAHFDSRAALAHAHGFAYALGIHPLYVDRADDDDLDRLRQALARGARRPAAGGGGRDRAGSLRAPGSTWRASSASTSRS